jgi:hypothetical protein
MRGELLTALGTALAGRCAYEAERYWMRSAILSAGALRLPLLSLFLKRFPCVPPPL